VGRYETAQIEVVELDEDVITASPANDCNIPGANITCG